MAESNGVQITPPKFGITFDTRISLSTMFKVLGTIFAITAAAVTLQLTVSAQGKRLNEIDMAQTQRYLVLQQTLVHQANALNRMEMYLATKDKNYWHAVREYPEENLLPDLPQDPTTLYRHNNYQHEAEPVFPPLRTPELLAGPSFFNKSKPSWINGGACVDVEVMTPAPCPNDVKKQTQLANKFKSKEGETK